jgi:hypothetical protein
MVDFAHRGEIKRVAADLPHRRLIHLGAEQPREDPSYQGWLRQKHAFTRQEGAMIMVESWYKYTNVGTLHFMSFPDVGKGEGPEIGRASCRERVYVQV